MSSLRPIFLPLVCLCSLASAQITVLSGTSVSMDAGTDVHMPGTDGLAVQVAASVENNGSITFGPQAELQEAPGAPITGTGTESTTRNYPVALIDVDPAGLGLRLTTSTATGITTVTRGHTTYIDNGGQASVLRWFDVDATVNSGLQATATFHLDPTELNGIAETDLLLHLHGPGASWLYVAPSTVNMVDHEVTSTDLDSLGLFTCFADVSTGVSPTSGNEGWALYPSLASSEVRLVAPEGAILDQVELFSADGKLLWQMRPGSTRSAIDVEGLHQGMYLVRINGSITIPFTRL